MKTLKKIKDAFMLFFKWDFKEEFISIALLFAAFLAANFYLGKAFPEAGFFNIPSQIETVVYTVLKFVLVFVLAWAGIRITLPPVYKFLRKQVYKKFEELPFDTKLTWALKIILTMLIVAAVVTLRAENSPTREKLVKLVYSQVGISEATENDSPEIRKFLAHVGIYKPASWCVAWVSYDLSAVGIDNPRSAWSPDYARQKDIIWTPKNQKIQPLPGDVPTFYYSNLGRVGHGCFYLKTDKSGYYITGEGNANQRLSRTGGQICILKRDPMKIHAISRFIK